VEVGSPRTAVSWSMVLLVAMAACAPGAAPRGTATTATAETGVATTQPAAGEPIRIGFLAPTSSVAAESAQDMVDGWNLFWDEHGLEVAGRPVEMFVEDDGGEPDLALSKARLLLEERRVHMLVGLLFAHTGYAVADYVEEIGTPIFYPVVAADDLTQRQRIPNLIRVAGNSSSQETHPFGEWVATEEGCEELYTIGSDYAYGHEVVGGFVNTFTDAGGSVIGQIWNPIGETDFSSYLATIQSAGPGCVFAIQVGGASIRFLQSWRDFGLTGDTSLYVGEDVLDQSILRGIEDPDLVEGVIGVGRYAEGSDDPATQAYVEKFNERYGKLSSYFDAASYVAGQWLAEAMEAVDGNVEDTGAFLDAVRAVELADTPMGPMRLDEYGNPYLEVFVRTAEAGDDGRLRNVPVHIFREVSQFWNYQPEEFLDQPVYSREYQGIDWP
jgi:branched-chain amino acid transport system substrate-binding protein